MPVFHLELFASHFFVPIHFCKMPVFFLDIVCFPFFRPIRFVKMPVFHMDLLASWSPFFFRYRFPQGGFLPRQRLPSVEFPSRASSSKPTPCHMRLPRIASAQGLSSNFFGACACHDEFDSHQRRVHPRLGVARCACHIPIRDVSFGTFALPRAPASVSTPWFSWPSKWPRRASKIKLK